MSRDRIAQFRKARSHPSLCVLEGFHAIKHGLRFGAKIRCLLAHPESRWRELADRLAPDVKDAANAICQPVSLVEFNELAPKPPHTGMIAIAERPKMELETFWQVERKAPIVILDDPSHPGNIGAVIRTAAAAGAFAVICTGDLDPWHPSVLRASAGLHFALHVASMNWPEIPPLKLTGLDADGEVLTADSVDHASVLVFGSERAGIGDEARARLSSTIAIPMTGGVSSLNLAASVAIMLYNWKLQFEQLTKN